MVLLRIIRKTKRKEKEMRILMVYASSHLNNLQNSTSLLVTVVCGACSGLDNAGKTTIVKSINNEDVNEVSPTMGFNIKSMPYGGYFLNIWDVGGQKTLRSYWKNYFEQTDGLVWVVDSSDRRRLNECAKELHYILMEERLAGASLLVFANKQDVKGALSEDEIRDVMKLELITNRHCKIVGCSARSKRGVDVGFDWIVQDIGNRVYLLA